MKRLLSATFVAAFCSQAIATPVYHPPGPNLTYGAVSNGQTLLSDINNPAAGALAPLKDGSKFRFGVLSSIGTGVEYGKIDNLFDDLDAIAADFDFSNAFSSIQNVNSAAALSEVDTRINDINDLLNNIENDGYGKAFISGHIPLMPMIVASDTLGGSLTLDLNFSGVVRVGAVADTVAFNLGNAQTFITNNLTSPVPVTSNLVDPTNNAGIGDVIITAGNNNVTYSLTNDSVVRLKAAGVLEAGFGYSRNVYSTNSGNLLAGIRGKYYQVTLYQDVEKVEDQTNTENLFEDFDYNDGETDTNFGVDLGLLWAGEHYRVGATLTNVNEPEFEYNAIDPAKLAVINDPRISALLSEKLIYKMESQLTIEGALHTKNQKWVFGAAYDVNEVEGPTGDEYQWATASAAFITKSWIIPGIRVGYRVNQAGSELSYLTGGITLFKYLNLDGAYGLEDVVIDGSTLPRSFMLNLGLELSF
ncbi:conjugal transfer protein TraF [Kaarinaea lacus]